MGRLTLATLAITLAIEAGSVALSSCSSAGCYDNRSSVPLAAFYSSTTLRPIQVSQLSIGGVDAPNDSLLVSNSTVGEVYLPLRSTATETKFVVRYEEKQLNDPELFDTLTFRYTAIPYFQSEECGAMYRYHIESYASTRHLIDSIAMTTDMVTNSTDPIIKIYFITK